MDYDKNARGGVRRYVDTTKPEEYSPDFGEVDLRELSLTGLADLYGSDKGSIKHLYTEKYEQLIQSLLCGRNRRETSLRVAEVGIACGASLRMWANYLPASKIFGFDIREDCKNLCRDLSNVQIEIVDPITQPLLKSNFDIFIDDASHISEDIFSIFNNCWTNVSPGGYYVIEDLSCTYNPDYAHQFSQTFGKQAINNRAVVLLMVDSIMRSIDQRKDVSDFSYHPQMLVIRKRTN